MATPPTLVADREGASWDTTTTPKTTAAHDSAVGDVWVAVVVDENDNGTENYTWSNTGTAQTFTEQTESNGGTGSDTWLQMATAIVGAALTAQTVSAARTAGSTERYGLNVVHFTGSDGLGAFAKTNGGAAGGPTLSITTTFDNSAIVYAFGDWNAADATTRTHRTVNGYTPTVGNGQELTYFRNSAAYALHIAYIPDAGAAGAKTVGLSAPTGMRFLGAAIEVRGSSAAATLPPIIVMPPRRH